MYDPAQSTAAPASVLTGNGLLSTANGIVVNPTAFYDSAPATKLSRSPAPNSRTTKPTPPLAAMTPNETFHPSYHANAAARSPFNRVSVEPATSSATPNRPRSDSSHPLQQQSGSKDGSRVESPRPTGNLIGSIAPMARSAGSPTKLVFQSKTISTSAPTITTPSVAPVTSAIAPQTLGVPTPAPLPMITIPAKRTYKTKNTSGPYVEKPPEILLTKRKRKARVFEEALTSDEDDLVQGGSSKRSSKSNRHRPSHPPSSYHQPPIYNPSSAPRATQYSHSAMMEYSDEDGVSDGDPPDFSTMTSIPLPVLHSNNGGGRSHSRSTSIDSGMGNTSGGGGDQPLRSFKELEEITFASPKSFSSMAYSIAASRGVALVLLEDRTKKTASAYLHMTCTYRRSGCPFILKLVKAKEGGWVLKTNTAHDVHYTARSWYDCSHPIGDEEKDVIVTARGGLVDSKGKITDPRWHGHYSSDRRSNAQAQVRPSYVPSPSASMSQQRKPLVGKDGFAISSSSRLAQHDDSDERYSYSNGNVVSVDRALAPPFERSVATMNVISPVLKVGGYSVTGQGRGRGNGATMGMAWDSTQRRAKFHPYPPSSTSNGPQYYDNNPLAMPHHLSTSDSPVPISSLPQWTALLTLVDPELIPFARLFASDTLACTPESFFKEEEAMRVALIEELEIGVWPKLKLKKGLVDRGELIWEQVKAMGDNDESGTGLSGINTQSDRNRERRKSEQKGLVDKEMLDVREPVQQVRKMFEEQEERRERKGSGPSQPHGIGEDIDKDMVKRDLSDTPPTMINLGTGKIRTTSITTASHLPPPNYAPFLTSSSASLSPLPHLMGMNKPTSNMSPLPHLLPSSSINSKPGSPLPHLIRPQLTTMMSNSPPLSSPAPLPHSFLPLRHANSPNLGSNTLPPRPLPHLLPHQQVNQHRPLTPSSSDNPASTHHVNPIGPHRNHPMSFSSITHQNPVSPTTTIPLPDTNKAGEGGGVAGLPPVKRQGFRFFSSSAAASTTGSNPTTPVVSPIVPAEPIMEDSIMHVN